MCFRGHILSPGVKTDILFYFQYIYISFCYKVFYFLLFFVTRFLRILCDVFQKTDHFYSYADIYCFDRVLFFFKLFLTILSLKSWETLTSLAHLKLFGKVGETELKTIFLYFECVKNRPFQHVFLFVRRIGASLFMYKYKFNQTRTGS